MPLPLPRPCCPTAAYNMDVTISYPAGYAAENIISVGSITSTGAISSFSNYGQTTVDLFAPGSGIYSTYPTSTYATLSGTSEYMPLCRAAAGRELAGKVTALQQWVGKRVRLCMLLTAHCARCAAASVALCSAGGGVAYAAAG